MKSSTYKVIIADDHTFFMDALKIVIEQYDDFKVVATCDNLQRLITLIEQSFFDLLILDINFNGIKSIEYLDIIKQCNKSFLIVCLSSYNQSYIKKEAFKNGIDFFYDKNDRLDDFPRILKELLEERKQIPILKLRSEDVDFTNRELDVLNALYEFTNDQEAAEYLKISLNTFKTHKQNLYKKTDSINNIQLIKYAIQKGFIVV